LQVAFTWYLIDQPVLNESGQLVAGNAKNRERLAGYYELVESLLAQHPECYDADQGGYVMGPGNVVISTPRLGAAAPEPPQQAAALRMAGVVVGQVSRRGDAEEEEEEEEEEEKEEEEEEEEEEMEEVEEEEEEEEEEEVEVLGKAGEAIPEVNVAAASRSVPVSVRLPDVGGGRHSEEERESAGSARGISSARRGEGPEAGGTQEGGSVVKVVSRTASSGKSGSGMVGKDGAGGKAVEGGIGVKPVEGGIRQGARPVVGGKGPIASGLTAGPVGTGGRPEKAAEGGKGGVGEGGTGKVKKPVKPGEGVKGGQKESGAVGKGGKPGKAGGGGKGVKAGEGGIVPGGKAVEGGKGARVEGGTGGKGGKAVEVVAGKVGKPREGEKGGGSGTQVVGEKAVEGGQEAASGMPVVGGNEGEGREEAVMRRDIWGGTAESFHSPSTGSEGEEVQKQGQEGEAETAAEKRGEEEEAAAEDA
jgi:hypothetical protein